MRLRWTGLLVAILIACIIIAYEKTPPPAPPATQAIATVPTTASKPITVATVPAEPVTLFELLRREQPAIAATQPLGVPVDLGDADRAVLNHPIWLDDVGHVWITYPNAETAEAAVKLLIGSNGRGECTHLVREPVKFVFWMNTGGRVSPNVLFEQADGSLAAATPGGVVPLPEKHAFRFDRAMSLVDSIAVPCEDGVCVLKFGYPQPSAADADRPSRKPTTIPVPTITEQFQALPASGDPLAQPQAIQGVRGLLAWTPATPTHAGSGVARFIDGAWKMLDTADWPTSVVQLTPFLDGTVQQLRQADEGKLELASVLLDTPTVDEKKIADLVDQLGDLSEAVRDKATNDLQRMGPSAWPVLQKLSNDQLPEVQQRLAILLAGVNTPSIGPMTPVDGKLTVVERYDNGGILVYADAGVTIPQPGKVDSATVTQAWIAIQPDRSPELLSDILMADFKAGTSHLWPNGDDWYRTDAVAGPKRFVGNALLSMLRPSEKKFWWPIGTDRRGRWLFRQPGKESSTLLLDPTIQDPTPRLPVWTIRLKAGSAGWTKEGWPAIKRGGAWALHEDGWEAVDEAKDPMLTTIPPKPAPPTPATEQSTSQPADLGPPLLTDSDGKTFFDGKLSLNITGPSTAPSSWSLPATATGVDPVTLIKTHDGKLFLFNQPGRVIRLSPQSGQAEPFKIEATFTRNIPNGDVVRIWLDPAGRICIVFDQGMAVLFPDGAIPHEISVKMSVEELKANEPE